MAEVIADSRSRTQRRWGPGAADADPLHLSRVSPQLYLAPLTASPPHPESPIVGQSLRLRAVQQERLAPDQDVNATLCDAYADGSMESGIRNQESEQTEDRGSELTSYKLHTTERCGSHPLHPLTNLANSGRPIPGPGHACMRDNLCLRLTVSVHSDVWSNTHGRTHTGTLTYKHLPSSTPASCSGPAYYLTLAIKLL